MDGLDLGSAGRASGSDVPDSVLDSDGRVLVLAGLGLAALGLAGSDVRLVFTADRLSEGLSGDLSEAHCSIRICTEVTATLTIRITTKIIKKGSFQGPFYIGRMS